MGLSVVAVPDTSGTAGTTRYGRAAVPLQRRSGISGMSSGSNKSPRVRKRHVMLQP